MNLGKLRELLNFLSLTEISEILGQDLLNGLSNIGITITKSSLIDMLLSTRGVSFLLEKNNRKILFSKPDIIGYLGITPQISNSFINSAWSRSYIKIAEVLSLESSDLLLDNVKREKNFTSSAEYPLMPYQNWMRKRVFDFFIEKENKRALLHMPTGAGKTSTAMQIIFDQIRIRSPENTTIIWMAHSDELCEQAINSFNEVWPEQKVSPAKIWRAWGGLSDLSDYDASGCNFVVTSFQTLYSWMISNENKRFTNINRLKRNSNFLVIDEAHLSTAPTYKNVINYVSGVTTKVLGLTATPGRHSLNDDERNTLELVDFFDDNLIGMTNDDGNEIDDPIDFLQSRGILSTVIPKIIPGTDILLSNEEILACSKQLELPETVLEKLSNDNKRTINIARITLELALQDGKQTIVFCSSKSNSLVLAEYLKLNGCSAAAITGDLAMSERHAKIEEFKQGKLKVITNYNVLTTGFDAPKINAVVIARPTLSVVLYSQMIGRGLRGKLFNGTEYTTIVNVEDNITNLPDFKSAFTYFNKFFEEEELVTFEY